MKNLTVLALAAILVGCGENSAATKNAKGKTAFDRLDDSAVLMSVGDCSLTKKEFESFCVMRAELAAIALRKKRDDKAIEQVAKTAASECTADFIRNAFLVKNAEKWLKFHGMAATNAYQAALARSREAFKARGSVKAVEKTLDQAGVGDYFRRRLEADSLVDAYVTTAFAKSNPVTDEGVKRLHDLYVAHQKIAAETNAVIKAFGEKIARLAQNGGDFVELADRCSMDPEKGPGGSMGECVEQDFAGDDEKLWKVIEKLPVGGVSDLLDADDSWQIYRVDGEVPADKSISKQPAKLLSRIYFRRVMEFADWNEKDAREQMELERRNRIVTAIIEHDLPKTEIRFPHGMEIVSFEGVMPFLNRKNELLKQSKEGK